MTAAILAKLKPLNRQRWDSAQLLKRSLPQADRAAALILSNRAHYERVQAETGVPWYIIGVKHMREANCNMKGVLHNGQQIVGTGRKTTIVPKGRGPFSTWHEAALDAIRLMKLDKVSDWSIERALYECERFNGFGYFNMGKPSPYVWAGTTVYVKGKYVSDGVYDPNHVDQQLGCAIVLKRLEQSGVQMDPPSYSISLVTVPEADDRDAVDAKSLPPVIADISQVAETPAVTTSSSFIAGVEDLTREQIEPIQKALYSKGYTEVGLYDGEWGIGSDAALRQFLLVNAIPEAGFVLMPGYAQTIALGKGKPVSQERASPETQVLNDRVPGRKEAWYVKFGSAVGTAVMGFFGWLASVVEDVQALFLQFGHYLSGMKPSTWLFIGAGVFLFVMLLARRVQKKGDTAFVEGKVR